MMHLELGKAKGRLMGYAPKHFHVSVQSGGDLASEKMDPNLFSRFYNILSPGQQLNKE